MTNKTTPRFQATLRFENASQAADTLFWSVLSRYILAAALAIFGGTAILWTAGTLG